jgi:hypothetical protein
MRKRLYFPIPDAESARRHPEAVAGGRETRFPAFP